MRTTSREQSRDVRKIADLYERTLVLVRPDHHVAWRANELPDDCLTPVDKVRGE